MLLTPDEVWSRESEVPQNDREIDSKGRIFSSNQSNVFEQSAMAIVDDQSFLHQLQIAPNVLTIVTNSETSSCASGSVEVQSAAINVGETAEDPTIEQVPAEINDETMDNNLHDENKSPNVSVKRCREELPGFHVVKKNVSTGMKFRSFEIKWDKVSDNTLSKLDALQDYKLKNQSSSAPKSMRLTKQERCGLINCIVDQLRAIDTCIQADIMETVAKDILRKYPCLEMVDDDGYGDGLSYVVLKHKLINHNSYLNRFKDPNHQTTKVTSQTRKCSNARAGTSKEYWAKSSPECAKELFVKLRRDEPNLLSDECLQSTHAFVRYRLDSHRDLRTLLLELPVLRRRKLLSYHFNQATGTDIDTLRKFFNMKRVKIIEYSAAVSKPGKLLESCSDAEIFQFLASMVGENLNNLVLKKEVGTRMEDIDHASGGPVLVAIDMGNDKAMYYVYAEQTRLSEGTEDIVGGIQDLMSVHYVHNFVYLKEASKFLELVQQYFLKIIPSKGSKSTANRVGPIQRVVKKAIETLSSYDASQPGPSNL
nr:uncharacterized protein LOC115267436 [Aedes albopictus]